MSRSVSFCVRWSGVKGLGLGMLLTTAAELGHGVGHGGFGGLVLGSQAWEWFEGNC